MGGFTDIIVESATRPYPLADKYRSTSDTRSNNLFINRYDSIVVAVSGPDGSNRLDLKEELLVSDFVGGRARWLQVYRTHIRIVHTIAPQWLV